MKINYRNLLFHSVLFALAWGIYVVYVMPLADQVTGPCEGTPGHDYKGAIVVLPIYFVLFGFWVFYLIRGLKSRLTKVLISTMILVVLPMVFAVAIISFFLNEKVITFIRERNAFDLFYEYGCYGDVDVQNILIGILTALCLALTLSCIRYINKS